MNTPTEWRLPRLLQLTSANLPVGAYAFSQGLEFAIESRWLRDAADVEEWLELQMLHSLARIDIALLMRMARALSADDEMALRHWNDISLACRETRELRLNDTETGAALLRLLPELDVPLVAEILPCSFITAYAQAVHHWKIDIQLSTSGYIWSWVEGQVMAATKLVPLGQTRAQQLLATLQEHIPAVIANAASCRDEELGAGLPALSIASMCHETQYTRLFRS